MFANPVFITPGMYIRLTISLTWYTRKLFMHFLPVNKDYLLEKQ